MDPVKKRWKLLNPDENRWKKLAEELNVSHIVAQLLVNRGIKEAKEGREFFSTNLTGLHKPETLPGAAKAADLLWSAVQNKEKITVYGDYDADGVTSTVILWQALKLIGADADYFVPSRSEDGYGVKAHRLREIAEKGSKWVVTVDCGVNSIEEALEADRLGLKLIVTDHHSPTRKALDFWLTREIPPVHPQLTDGDYAPFPIAPFTKLSGAVVAFKLAWLLGKRHSGREKVTKQVHSFLMHALGLATIGLIADVMPLLGENRLLVRHGLQQIRETHDIGLKQLLSQSGIDTKKELRASDVAFRIGPRINAAGRMDRARMVVDLLTTQCGKNADTLGEFLRKQNAERQSKEKEMLREAREMIVERGFSDAPAFVLASEKWHEGIVGIVAGRLAAEFARPTLVIATGKGPAKGVGVGSGRDTKADVFRQDEAIKEIGFELHKALEHCSDVLISSGGHKAAAGFRIEPDKIDALRAKFCEYVLKEGQTRRPKLLIDAELPLSALTFGQVRQMSHLEPYGEKNEKPRILIANASMSSEPKTIGNGDRHVSFRIAQGNQKARCVGWAMGDRIEELKAIQGPFSLVVTPFINDFNGFRSVELEVIDFRDGPPELE